MSQDHETPESPLPPLHPPDFKSNIPDYLTTDISEQDKWLLNQMSLNTQMTEYLLKTLIETHDYVRNTNGRTRKNEDKADNLGRELAEVKTRVTSIAPSVERGMAIWAFITQKWFVVTGLILTASFVFTIFFLISHAGAGTFVGDVLKALAP